MLTTLLIAALVASTAAHAETPDPLRVPTNLPDSVRNPLNAKREPLDARRIELTAAGASINRDCASVVRGSKAHDICLERKRLFDDQTDALSDEIIAFIDQVDAAVERHIVSTMNALAKRLNWTVAERARVDSALRNVSGDGDPTATDAQIAGAWDDILARGAGSDLARAAAGGDGIGFPGAGMQGAREDCVVFALANAAGVPYGFAAALATRLIREGEWREAPERANPQQTIEKLGMIKGEVIMLAEALGQARLVGSADFARTIRAGSPVIVSVVPKGAGSAHEVVLVKAFQHEGAQWYAMMDSHQGAVRRLYLSARELDILLLQKGVAYRPEPGRTPRSLK
ncbi:MAG: hypothetical protein ACR2G6_07385 [Gemmatimonadaceae bacterium]